MELTNIIPILEQRRVAYQQIDDNTFKLYDQLQGKDYVHVEKEHGEIVIAFVSDPGSTPIFGTDLLYLNPISITMNKLYEEREQPVIGYVHSLRSQ